MLEGICDIETDGLNPTVVHCIGFLDVNTEEERLFYGDTLKDFPAFAETVSTFIGHNFLSFDAPVLLRLLGVRIPVDKITDTLILSRLLYTGVYPKHSLEFHGDRLGCPKGKHADFSKFSPEMLEYMRQDLRTNLKLYREELKDLSGYSDFCVRLEHDTQDILNQMKTNGFWLDTDRAYPLHAELKAKRDRLEQEILEFFPPKMKLVETYTPRFNKDGTMNAASKAKIERADKVKRSGSEYKLYTEKPFNLGSPQQVVERMNEIGWNPVEFTDTGAPKLSEANFDTLPPDAPEGARKIGEWMMLRHRVNVLEEWFNCWNPKTRRMHGTVVSIGAWTQRMAHREPQMGNIPAVRSPYGPELRDLLGVEDRENWRMVGADLSGIQLRILAHYINDPQYTELVCSKDKGNDIHTFNRDIISTVHTTDRDGAKTFIYAMLLGAQGPKLGSIIGGTDKEGYLAKDALFERIPGFKRVQKMCAAAARRGYMIGLDGRRVPIKSQHTALACYLQNGEAIVMKQSLRFMRARIHFPWHLLAVVHDEAQSETPKEFAQELGEIKVKCFEDAGKFFDLRCPVTGEFKIGLTWKECH